jgi:hypothetical protein
MAEKKTAEQVRDDYLRVLGRTLGTLSYALYNEVTWLYYWSLAGCGKTRRKTISVKCKHYYDHESASWINVVRGQKTFPKPARIGCSGDVAQELTSLDRLRRRSPKSGCAIRLTIIRRPCRAGASTFAIWPSFIISE